MTYLQKSPPIQSTSFDKGFELIINAAYFLSCLFEHGMFRYSVQREKVVLGEKIEKRKEKRDQRALI